MRLPLSPTMTARVTGGCRLVSLPLLRALLDADRARQSIRLRLMELENDGPCQAELRRLRPRRADVVDIEHELEPGALP